MKFRVDRDVLAEAVGWAARTLPTRPPVPVLAGLMVEAGSGRLVLSSFDYEVSARVEVDAEVDEPGTALVSGRLLADITRSLSSRPVEVRKAEDGPKVEVLCGSARFALLTLPLGDYPSLPDLPPLSGTIEATDFAAAVASVAVAAGRDDTLPVLTGVRVEIDGDRLTLAATDRYRLAVRELRWAPERTDGSAFALIPARSLSDTARAMSSASTLRVSLAASSTGEGLAGFEADGRRATMRLLDGEFPKYRSLLPDQSSTHASVETSALIEAVKRVALVAERNTPVRLAFADDQVLLEAGTGDEASASEALPAALVGESVTIAFNPTFLLDGLQSLETPYAELAFTTSTKPAVLSGKAAEGGDADSSYRYLIMPVRMSG